VSQERPDERLLQRPAKDGQDYPLHAPPKVEAGCEQGPRQALVMLSPMREAVADLAERGAAVAPGDWPEVGKVQAARLEGRRKGA
jgi:hypothetical protein